ncbi:hypothetical protein HMPREF9072_02211, partial [Capnocytophaga sp. oral taxon 324 str. F0483]
MKAIHNGGTTKRVAIFVVINRKTTKFESNSQRIVNVSPNIFCCYQSQNYKI